MYETVKLGCASCHHSYDDLIVRADRDAWFVCPACGEPTLRRMLSAPNVRTRTSASFVDGTKRFSTIKELEKLKRIKGAAKKANDQDTVKYASKHIADIKGD